MTDLNDTKMVLVWRKDLKVRTGKLASQIAHAALASFKKESFIKNIDGIRCLCIPLDNRNEPWLIDKFTKICVYVNNEQELLDIYNKANQKGLYCSLIKDVGNTEFHGVSTYTAVGIGPAFNYEIDEITGHLPLL